jgi:hypothetical protein
MTNAERQKRYRDRRDEKLGLTRGKIRKPKRRQGTLAQAARLEREVQRIVTEALSMHDAGRLSNEALRAKLDEIREATRKFGAAPDGV